LWCPIRIRYREVVSAPRALLANIQYLMLCHSARGVCGDSRAVSLCEDRIGIVSDALVLVRKRSDVNPVRRRIGGYESCDPD
jgi:hypothetical protein